MESAAVAHVCHANGIPFLSIRTITDSADRSAAACFEENCRRASEIAAQVTHALLKRLAVSESYPIEKENCHDAFLYLPKHRLPLPSLQP